MTKINREYHWNLNEESMIKKEKIRRDAKESISLKIERRKK